MMLAGHERGALRRAMAAAWIGAKDPAAARPILHTKSAAYCAFAAAHTRRRVPSRWPRDTGAKTERCCLLTFELADAKEMGVDVHARYEKMPGYEPPLNRDDDGDRPFRRKRLLIVDQVRVDR